MKVYRIERERYLSEVLKGFGAAQSRGSRWNSFQTRLVYTAASRALAILEIAVHLDISEDLPKDRFIVEIEIPDYISIQKTAIDSLPVGWNRVPPGKASQAMGDDFVRKRISAILQVPSVIVPQECNYLINPLHDDIQSIAVTGIHPLVLDHRLSGKLY